MLLPPLLDATLFAQIRASYEGCWPLRLMCCDGAGRRCDAGDGHTPAADLAAQAIEQALRYGDPILLEGDGDRLCWAVPVLCNQRLLGGLIACCDEQALFPAQAEEAAFDLRRAMRELRELAEAHDLCNSALLAGRRERQEQERQRAAEIHAAKHGSHRGLVAAYLERERALLTAVRSGRRDQARAVLNELLVAYYHAGGRQLELLKSLLLELVVMLCRSAVEVGARQEEVFGLRFASLAELVHIDDDEALSRWLTACLERIFAAIEGARSNDALTRRREIEQVLAERCGEEDLDRAAVAAEVGMEAAELGSFLSEQASQTFNEALAKARIERARDLLQHDDMSLLQIALEVGFKDPSYFSKVFRKLSGVTPRDYRRMARSEAEA